MRNPLLSRPLAQVRSAPVTPLAGRCRCGGRKGLGGECEACRARRLGTTPPRPRSLTPPERAHDFGLLDVHARRRAIVQRQADPTMRTTEEEIPLQPGELEAAAVGGAGLASGDRLRLESHFGQGLDGVRVHADSRANALCRRERARAFAYGDHVFFRAGEYRPGTPDGRRLLTHELAHVLQQRSGRATSASEERLEHEADRAARAEAVSCPVVRAGAAVPYALRRKRVQRWRYATAADANPLPAAYGLVPAAHQPRVNQAMGIIQRIVNDRPNYRRCHDFFQNNCPGGAANTLTNELAAAIVWQRVNPPANMLASNAGGTHHIAYGTAYAIGRWAIAASFVHELIHTCGEPSHVIGDNAKAACGQLPNV